MFSLNDLSLEKAYEDAPGLLEIVRELVKPERDKLSGNADASRRKKFWWHWGRNTQSLDQVISPLERVIVISEITPHLAFCFLPRGYVYAHTLKIFAFGDTDAFSLLQSRVHEIWVRFLGSTFEDRINMHRLTSLRIFHFLKQGVLGCFR